MWTLIQATRLRIARLTVRALVASAVALFAATTVATPVKAQEYVIICDIYGSAFYYIPGTDTCVNSTQILANQFAAARLNTFAATGTAMAASLVAPWLPTGTNFAVSNHWATFDGQHAVGFSGLMRISGNFVFSGGFATGLDRGSLLTTQQRTQTEFGTSVPKQSWNDVRALGRAGFMYAW